MLQYPWQQPMPATVAQHDLDYYVPRSDPGGPSMDDAINQIDTAALGTPGCASYVFTQRSIEPFMRDAFDQFSETRTGGAFTFTTGIGGFLQEFLYGYSGLRWNGSAVQLDPSLNAGIGGVVLRNLHWQGRTFTVDVGPSTTTVSLTSGSAMPVTVRGAAATVAAGHSLTIPTRRPDLTPTNDVVRCRPATASSAAAGADPLAAVDGSPSTDWQPSALPATLTVPLGAAKSVHSATLDWGRMWPPAPAPNVPPPPWPGNGAARCRLHDRRFARRAHLAHARHRPSHERDARRGDVPGDLGQLPAGVDHLGVERRHADARGVRGPVARRRAGRRTTISSASSASMNATSGVGTEKRWRASSSRVTRQTEQPPSATMPPQWAQARWSLRTCPTSDPTPTLFQLKSKPHPVPTPPKPFPFPCLPPVRPSVIRPFGCS